MASMDVRSGTSSVDGETSPDDPSPPTAVAAASSDVRFRLSSAAAAGVDSSSLVIKDAEAFCRDPGCHLIVGSGWGGGEPALNGEATVGRRSETALTVARVNQSTADDDDAVLCSAAEMLTPANADSATEERLAHESTQVAGCEVNESNVTESEEVDNDENDNNEGKEPSKTIPILSSDHVRVDADCYEEDEDNMENNTQLPTNIAAVSRRLISTGNREIDFHIIGSGKKSSSGLTHEESSEMISETPDAMEDETEQDDTMIPGQGDHPDGYVRATLPYDVLTLQRLTSPQAYDNQPRARDGKGGNKNVLSTVELEDNTNNNLQRSPTGDLGNESGDIYSSEPDAENDRLDSTTTGGYYCPIHVEECICSGYQRIGTVPVSAAEEDGIHSSGDTSEDVARTRAAVKVSKAFIDLTASPEMQAKARDRASSESGKDRLTAAILAQKAELPPKKTSTNRVGSIRKSLIKLGTFGKDHINNGKGKSRKDKEKERSKTESADLPSLRRIGSDRVSGPFSFALPNLQSQKSPDARLSGRFVTSPLPTCQTDISNPQAVEDPEKLEQFSKQKLNTMQMMYDQARRECEELKQELQKKPTELVRASLEAKTKVFRRLESQLSMYGGDVDVPSGEKRFCRRESSFEGGSLPVADGDRDSSSRPPQPPPPHYTPRHKGSDAGVPPQDECAEKQEIALSRSHSDSYKRIKKAGGSRLRFTVSTDEIQKLTAAASGEFEIGSRLDEESYGQSKSQEAASDDSSDPALNRSCAVSEHPPLMPGAMIHDASDGSRIQSNIIAIDDYEFGSDEDIPDQVEDLGSPFSDFNILKDRPAHLAIFLHYLISNSDASPLLFYLMSGHSYTLGATKELRKWAYEIYSTFLAAKAPLQIKVDESYLESINDVLLNKFDKEDAMRGIFTLVREGPVLLKIKELLADYRGKRALGLGGLYGENDLKEGLDHAGELKIVDNVLWKHLEQAADDDCERSLVLASALATYMKQIGCINTRNSHTLERCPTFNAKDKTRFSMFGKGPRKERGYTHRNHNFLPQHYYYVTNCNFCQTILFGVGSQGYQCQKCDQSFHKTCLEKIQVPCSGKKSKPTTMLDKLMNKKLTNSSALGTESHMERTISMPSIREVAGKSTLSYKPSFAGLNFWDKARGHKDPIARALDKYDPPKSLDEAKPTPLETPISDILPNDEHQNDAPEMTAKSPPSYKSTITFNVPPYSSIPADNPSLVSFSSLSITGDPELDVEQDLPPLEAVIPKDHLKKLDKKEKKRQEVINELFYTERTHLRDIKVMKLLFYVPMSSDPSLAELANFVFPDIQEIYDFHSSLNKQFMLLRNASDHGIIGDFAEHLVTYFSGETGWNFKMACGQFCEKQSQAQEQLKARQRKDPKLATLLHDASSNSACRRLTLKDFLPIPMQRLTKYPLLIENLIKYTPAECEEGNRLRAALDCSREILLYVNKAVNDYQNRQKLIEYQKKLDVRPIENSLHPLLKNYKNLDLTLTNYTLLFDGLLTWRINRDRMIQLQVVLLNEIMLLLQKQDDSRLVLRCESTSIVPAVKEEKKRVSPIINLKGLMLRTVATDKLAFFLISDSENGSQIYELVASSKDEKNRWWKHISTAVTAVTPDSDKPQSSNKSKKANLKQGSASELHFVGPDLDRKHDEALEVNYGEEEETAEAEGQKSATVALALADHNEDEGNGALDINFGAESSCHSSASNDPIDQLKLVDDVIQQMMCEKDKILSQFWAESNADESSKLYGEPNASSDFKLLLTTLRETDHLMCLVNKYCTQVTSETASSPSEALISDTDKAVPDGEGITSSVADGSKSSSPTPLTVSQIMELNSKIYKHLLHLLDSAMRNEEEKQKLLMDLHLAQEKLAILEISHSGDQAAEFSAYDRLEPTSEMTTDLYENEMHPEEIVPAAADSKEFDSIVNIGETFSANEFDANRTADSVITSEEPDGETPVSITLATDDTDIPNSSEV